MHKIYFLLIALSFILNAFGQDWKWINPRPSGNQINAVKFIDSSTAIAVGNYGTIIKTNTSGQSWIVQNSHTNTDLLSISPIDKDTIYISGRNLSVLKTIDGGDSWSVIRSGYGNRNTSQVFFNNSVVGYLLGDGIEEFFKTSDSGKNWTKMEVDLNFQGVTSLYFTSVDTGYASIGNGMGGSVLKSTDGGLHWTTIALPVHEQFNKVIFTDKKIGYLVGNSGHILKTEDAGESWTVQNQFPSNLTNSNLLSVDFINNEIGFTVGEKDMLKTIDGGNHWELIGHSDFYLHSVSFRDSLYGICAGGDWLHELSGIIKTENGGKNWAECSTSVTSSYINRIRFVNANVGYAIGGSSSTYGGFILKTNDSGETWSPLNTGINTYWISDLSLPDEKIVYVVGEQGQVFKSNDSGVSWQKQNTNTTEKLNSVCFLNASNGYTVGGNGTILKTIDGGKNWVKQESPTSMQLNSAFFKDSDTGYIVAYDWTIDSCTVLLATTDGGLNWNKRSIGKLRYPNIITFVNKDTAFIAGSFGGILRTTDGGKNWIDSYHNGNDHYDMFFTTESTGYVVGFNGEISMTENCGNDWTVLNSGTNKDLLSICFTDVNTGFAVGSNGIILKTTNSGSSLNALRQPLYELCLGDSAVISPNFLGGTKPLSYTWDNSETSPAITVAPENSTIYKMIIKDHEMDTIHINIPVYVYSVPIPQISLRGDTLFSNVEYGNQWYRNDSLLTNIYSNKFVPELSGDYYSIVHNYNCYSEKPNVIHLLTGINDKTVEDEITVYPNPATSYLIIGFPQNYCQGELTIVDVHGRQIRKQMLTGNREQVSISDLTNGFYFVQIVYDDFIITKKVVKK